MHSDGRKAPGLEVIAFTKPVHASQGFLYRFL
jgi:hypothetical protein